METAQMEIPRVSYCLIMLDLVENKNRFNKGMENNFRSWCDFDDDCLSPVGESQWRHQDALSLVEPALNSISMAASCVSGWSVHAC
jgi:hypothetical protein